MDLSPLPDDGLLTVAASLARHSARKVENGDSSCFLKVMKVLEVTSYFHNDSYKVVKVISMDVCISVYEFKINFLINYLGFSGEI